MVGGNHSIGKTAKKHMRVLDDFREDERTTAIGRKRGAFWISGTHVYVSANFCGIP